MTREEAIAQLKMDRDLANFNPMTGEEEPMNEDCRKSVEALDMAIKALEQQPCEDTISRQAAIDACHNYEDGKDAYAYGDVVEKRLKTLPSAEPDQRWIPCSERVPEEDTEVLISYRYKEGEGDTDHVNIDITSYGTVCFGGREIHTLKEWRQPFDYFHANYEVIAWMPLPEPYREELNRKGEKDEG